MFEKVLVPTDLSKRSHRILGCTGQLPDVKEVVLLNVVVRDPSVEAWNPLAELKNAKARLVDQAKYLEETGIIINTKAEMMSEGEGVSSVLRRVADEENVSLIVIGIEPKGSLQDRPLKGVYRDMLCNDDTHLLAISDKLLDDERALQEDLCSHILTKVLLPTDLSLPVRAATFFVAKSRGIKNIVLLHVIPEGGSKEEMDAKVKAATNALNALADELAGKEGLKVTPPLGVRLSGAALRCHICSKGLNITCRVVVGNIAEEINEMADKENVSLIAMSSMGKSSPSGNQIGRTAYDVANTATRPVLVIRTDKVPMFR